MGLWDDATSINEEREIPGRQKVVREPKVPVLTSHAGLNPRSKSGNESCKAGEASFLISALSLTASLDICCANWYRADTASIYSGNEPVTASYHACSGAESGKTGEASKSAAVFTPVDNDILDGPFFCNYTIASQFVVVKKRNAKNVKNKNKKRFQKKLSQPERLGELKLYRLI